MCLLLVDTSSGERRHVHYTLMFKIWLRDSTTRTVPMINRRVNLIMIHVHFCGNGDIRGQSLGS